MPRYRTYGLVSYEKWNQENTKPPSSSRKWYWGAEKLPNFFRTARTRKHGCNLICNASSDSLVCVMVIGCNWTWTAYPWDTIRCNVLACQISCASRRKARRISSCFCPYNRCAPGGKPNLCLRRVSFIPLALISSLPFVKLRFANTSNRINANISKEERCARCDGMMLRFQGRPVTEGTRSVINS